MASGILEKMVKEILQSKLLSWLNLPVIMACLLMLGGLAFSKSGGIPYCVGHLADT
jgi:membrane-bound ClpP family serine protease